MKSSTLAENILGDCKTLWGEPEHTPCSHVTCVQGHQGTRLAPVPPTCMSFKCLDQLSRLEVPDVDLAVLRPTHYPLHRDGLAT